MLNKDEELRVDLCIKVVKSDVDQGLFTTTLKARTAQWLAEKLKETNDELVEVYEEIALTARSVNDGILEAADVFPEDFKKVF